MKIHTRKASVIGGIVFFSLFFIYLASGRVNALVSLSINLDRLTGQHLSHVNPAGLPMGAAARTTEAWIKTTNPAEQAIIDFGTDAGLYHAWEFVVAEDVIGVRLNGGNAFWTANDVTDGDWHHVALVYSGEGAVDTNTIAYMDGIALVQASAVSAIPDTTDDWIYLGGAGTPVAVFFDGQIDEVRIWNVARSSTEIAKSIFGKLKKKETGLVGYWKFDGGLLVDESGNNNDLMNNNDARFSTDVPPRKRK